MTNGSSQKINEKIIKAAKKIFGKGNIKSIESLSARYTQKHKIVVFVPLENADELAFAMASAGAGVIGNYTVCSFRVKGVGTFIGGESSNPSAGKKGNFEMIEEVRLEMLCGVEYLDGVIDKIYEVHPYEEPAYEIYNIKVRNSYTAQETAILKLKRKTTVKKVLEQINKGIDSKTIPAKFGKTSFKQAVIDFSGESNSELYKFRHKTLYISRKNNTTYLEIK